MKNEHKGSIISITSANFAAIIFLGSGRLLLSERDAAKVIKAGPQDCLIQRRDLPEFIAVSVGLCDPVGEDACAVPVRFKGTVTKESKIDGRVRVQDVPQSIAAAI